MDGEFKNMSTLKGSLSGGKTLSGGISREIVNKDYNELVNKPRINDQDLVGDNYIRYVQPKEVEDIFRTILGGNSNG